VSLKTRLAEELPAVPGDRVQLQQVVLNLILNAIEATREIEGRPRQVSRLCTSRSATRA
jgi:signal transduction histidine kinase